MDITGNLVDLVKKEIYPARVLIEKGKIVDIKRERGPYSTYLLPGFIDAHIHIESSMLVPSEFARIAVTHGTVGTVSDPHEIGNVLGIKGVKFMIENGKKVPFHFNFGAPSCVPATGFETAGAEISAGQIRELFQKEGLKYLSEMMNYPGVLHKDPVVLEKIKAAVEAGVPVDGHAPGLKGEDARNYIAAGISTDHECFALDEALGKVDAGMKIIIREGSAAKNYNALHTLLKTHPEKVMFCSDDKHPDELVRGHINELVKRSIALEYDLFDVLRAASINPIEHYKLDIGYLQKGQSADFIVVDNLTDFNVLETYVRGEKVASYGASHIKRVEPEVLNNFSVKPTKLSDYEITGKEGKIRVIEALDGELITNEIHTDALVKDGKIVSNPDKDILKLVVINRYHDAPIAKAFIKGFGLNRGALASCIAHDSHNIIAVGADDESLMNAVNAVINNKGGISVAVRKDVDALALPIAGILSPDDGYKVAEDYSRIDEKVKVLGTPLRAPFMTLSFMALLVIPSLKLSDKGLFDGKAFKFTELTI